MFPLVAQGERDQSSHFNAVDTFERDYTRVHPTQLIGPEPHRLQQKHGRQLAEILQGALQRWLRAYIGITPRRREPQGRKVAFSYTCPSADPIPE